MCSSCDNECYSLKPEGSIYIDKMLERNPDKRLSVLSHINCVKQMVMHCKRLLMTMFLLAVQVCVALTFARHSARRHKSRLEV